MSSKIGKISVIIPVYNAEKYLARCVDSLLSQTYGDLEIIIIDDGSKDGSGALIDGYAERDGRITAVHKENGGVSSARNLGLKQAHGEYIAFIDADDYVKENYIEVLYKSAKENGADMACCGCVWLIDGDADKDFNTVKTNRVLTDRAEYFLDVLEEKEFYNRVVWGKIIKAEMAKALSFDTDIKYGEDTLYMLKLFSKSPKAALTSYVGYYYIQNTEGAMGSAGMCNPALKMQHIICYRYMFSQREGLPENVYGGVVNYYAKNICGTISVCLKQKTKDDYNRYKGQLLSYANEVKPYKKYVQRYFKIRLSLFRRTPNLYWAVFHLVRRRYHVMRYGKNA